jgi:hypothetical protein
MRIKVGLLLLSLLPLQLFAISDATRPANSVTIVTEHVGRVVTLFSKIAALDSRPGGDAAATECGYIFPGDGSKFGCKGSGKAAADVAAACSGGGSLACTGSGSGRTCTCAFD